MDRHAIGSEQHKVLAEGEPCVRLVNSGNARIRSARKDHVVRLRIGLAGPFLEVSLTNSARIFKRDVSRLHVWDRNVSEAIGDRCRCLVNTVD